MGASSLMSRPHSRTEQWWISSQTTKVMIGERVAWDHLFARNYLG